MFWGPELDAERIYDHAGTGIEYNVNGDLVFSFKRNTFFAPIFGMQSDTLRPQDFDGLTFNRKFAEDFGGIVFGTNPVSQFSLRTQIIRGGAVNIVVPQGQLPNEGDETTINQTLTLKPVGQLQIDNTYILDRVVHNRVRHAVFNNHIIRSKWNYQVNREMSFRFIAQYQGLLVNSAYSSLDTTKNMNFDFLITYLVHPGTALYVGYNSNLENLAPGLCVRLPGTIECDPNGNGLARTPGHLINDGRVFFIKLSYLFRR